MTINVTIRYVNNERASNYRIGEEIYQLIETVTEVCCDCIFIM